MPSSTSSSDIPYRVIPERNWGLAWLIGVTLVIAGAMALHAGRPLLGRVRNQPLLVLRSLLGVAGVTCYFYAIDRLLLADATMLTRLSPFFVAVFALAFLGERPSRLLNMALMILQYVFVVVLVVAGYFTAVMLAVILALRSLLMSADPFLLNGPDHTVRALLDAFAPTIDERFADELRERLSQWLERHSS